MTLTDGRADRQTDRKTEIKYGLLWRKGTYTELAELLGNVAGIALHEVDVVHVLNEKREQHMACWTNRIAVIREVKRIHNDRWDKWVKWTREYTNSTYEGGVNTCNVAGGETAFVVDGVVHVSLRLWMRTSIE